MSNPKKSNKVIGEKCRGKVTKILRGWRNFSPTNKTPDILSPGHNFNLIFLSSTETFPQNFILHPKIKSKILHPELQKLVL